ncbi:leucine-rich colipase-like protein 1 [Phoca vitulina]|uniref:leucine-rich colipase-like protein 1 n=1 Tax=Phoca vitulina TaxID=9720 RepID=UPI0013961F21|nr:leucine-rich colipase-like protein 1 [Phoca vitulina]
MPPWSSDQRAFLLIQTSLAPSLSLSSGSPGHRTHRVWNIPGTVKVRRRKGRVFLAGSWVCREGGKGRPALQRLGEACEHHAECRGRCCVTTSLNPQTFCAPRTVFLKCLPWRKPDRHACSDHAECRSRCCVTSSLNPQTFCVPRTILLQCVPWRKVRGRGAAGSGRGAGGGCQAPALRPQPNGADCSRHGDCRSQCCIALHEAGRSRCTRRSGLLAQCLPL